MRLYQVLVRFGKQQAYTLFVAIILISSFFLYFSLISPAKKYANSLLQLQMQQKISIYDKNATLLYTNSSDTIAQNKIPTFFKMVLLHTYDKSFFTKNSADIFQLMNYIRHKKARNSILYSVALSSLQQKAASASDVTRFSQGVEYGNKKDAVFGLFANSYIFDSGYTGFQKAALFSFGKNLTELSEAEQLALVAESKGRKDYKKNYKIIIQQLIQDKIITENKERKLLSDIPPLGEYNTYERSPQVVTSLLPLVNKLSRQLPLQEVAVYLPIDNSLTNEIQQLLIEEEINHISVGMQVLIVDNVSHSLLSYVSTTKDPLSYNHSLQLFRYITAVTKFPLTLIDRPAKVSIKNTMGKNGIMQKKMMVGNEQFLINVAAYNSEQRIISYMNSSLSIVFVAPANTSVNLLNTYVKEISDAVKKSTVHVDNNTNTSVSVETRLH